MTLCKQFLLNKQRYNNNDIKENPCALQKIGCLPTVIPLDEGEKHVVD